MISSEGLLCAGIGNVAEDRSMRECDSSMLKTIDSDEFCLFLLHVLQSYVHYIVYSF